MKNETIEQQRKAREEFLELKKMQSGEITPEPVIHEKDAMPKTVGEKIKNNWFHDKWFYIIGGFIAILVIVTAIQAFSKPKADLEVVIFTTAPVSSANAERAADYLEQFCEDINGDGEVIIQTVNCSSTQYENSTYYNQNTITKLQSVLAADANALLYITDEAGYDYINAIADNGVFEDNFVKLDDEFYEYCNKDIPFKLPENLIISCRSIKDMMISNNKNIDEYYEQSQNIINSLK